MPARCRQFAHLAYLLSGGIASRNSVQRYLAKSIAHGHEFFFDVAAQCAGRDIDKHISTNHADYCRREIIALRIRIASIAKGERPYRVATLELGNFCRAIPFDCCNTQPFDPFTQRVFMGTCSLSELAALACRKRSHVSPVLVIDNSLNVI